MYSSPTEEPKEDLLIFYTFSYHEKEKFINQCERKLKCFNAQNLYLMSLQACIKVSGCQRTLNLPCERGA